MDLLELEQRLEQLESKTAFQDLKVYLSDVPAPGQTSCIP